MRQRGGNWGSRMEKTQEESGGGGEIAHPLKALVALPDDLGSVPSTHITAVPGVPIPSSDLHQQQ